MSRYIRVAALTLIVSQLANTTIAKAAVAAQPCASRSDFVALLKDHFGEVKAGQGLSSRGHLVEVFISPAGNWTILLSQPHGLSCVVDDGEAWVTVPSADQSRKALRLSPLAAPGPLP